MNNQTIKYSNCPVPNGLLVAARAHDNLTRDALAKEGIELQLLSGQQGTLHFTYDDPAYTRFGGEIPPLVSEGLRAPGRTRLLGLSLLKTRQGIYVGCNSALRTAADLRGKKVGVSGAAIRILRDELGDYRELADWAQTLIALGSWEARALLHTLEAGGLSVADVELVRIYNPWVDLPAEQLERVKKLDNAGIFSKVNEGQGALLEQGHVDALFSWLPWAAELVEKIGARLLVDLDADPRNQYVSTWTISSDLVERSPEVVQRLVDAVVERTIWAKEHATQVAKIHAENFGLSDANVRTTFGPEFHQDLLPSLDSRHLAVLGQTQGFLLKHHLIDHPVDFSQWAAPEFLASSIERLVQARKAA